MPRGRGKSGGGTGEGRGGPRTPTTPAAVSTQGATASRTDGGPSNPKVDLTGFESQRFGQRQRLEALAKATGGQGGPGGAQVPVQQQPAQERPLTPEEQMGVFAPATGRSYVPDPHYQTALNSIPSDPDILVRAMYQKYRHPDLLRILMMRG